MAAAAGSPTSNVYQVPLNSYDTRFYKPPTAQAAQNPLNCGATSALLLGLISRPEAEAESARNQAVMMEAIAERLKADGINTTVTYVESIREPFASLFHGFATLILALRDDDIGHFFVIAKDDAGVEFILDPQVGLVQTDIPQYMIDQRFNGRVGYLRVFFPKTVEEFTDYHAETVLTRQLSQCSLVDSPVFARKPEGPYRSAAENRAKLAPKKMPRLPQPSSLSQVLEERREKARTMKKRGGSKLKRKTRRAHKPSRKILSRKAKDV